MAIQWDDFRYFQAVKTAGTLKGAAKIMGTDQATVGRRLYALEASLGSKLFEKRSNGYFLTEAGERITEKVNLISGEFDGIHRALSGVDSKLEGVIKIASPGALVNNYLIPRLKNFLLANPSVTLHFLTGPEVVNLSKREADLAIRLVRPSQQNLFVKKLGVMRLSFYASKNFTKDHKNIKSHEHWLSCPFIGLDENSMSDLEDELVTPIRDRLNYALKTHAWETVYEGIRSDLGFGVLPSFMVVDDSLCEELKHIEPLQTSIWMVVHPDLKANAKVKALIEALKVIFDR